jgi:hypothetical protein
MDFREYIETEIRTILGEMDEASRFDPERRSQRAIEWIEKHAADFRRQWNTRQESEEMIA